MAEERTGYHLIQSVDGPLVVCPPDAEGHREALTIQQAHSRLDEMHRTMQDHTHQDECGFCDLYDLLHGIR